MSKNIKKMYNQVFSVPFSYSFPFVSVQYTLFCENVVPFVFHQKRTDKAIRTAIVPLSVLIIVLYLSQNYCIFVLNMLAASASSFSISASEAPLLMSLHTLTSRPTSPPILINGSMTIAPW